MFQSGVICSAGVSTFTRYSRRLAARPRSRCRVPWKIFHEINFVNIDYEKFDASEWDLLESGLFGPVRLIPMKAVTPR